MDENSSKRARKNFLEQIKTPRGGYTRAQLDFLGVSWPPQKGWKKKLEETKGGITREMKIKLLQESSL